MAAQGRRLLRFGARNDFSRDKQAGKPGSGVFRGRQHWRRREKERARFCLAGTNSATTAGKKRDPQGFVAKDCAPRGGGRGRLVAE